MERHTVSPAAGGVRRADDPAVCGTRAWALGSVQQAEPGLLEYVPDVQTSTTKFFALKVCFLID